MTIKKQPIQEPVNPRKRAKENNLTDVEKFSPKEAFTWFCHKIDNKADNNENTHGSDY